MCIFIHINKIITYLYKYIKENQNMPPQNIPLCHKDSFELMTIEKEKQENF